MPNQASSAKRLSVTSSILLLAIFFIYCGVWIGNNRGLLFDSKLHNEDVRSHVFPFHRFGPGKLLNNDPIANERLSMDPIGVRLLYRILVPIIGIYTSPKVVQALCLLCIFIGAFILIKSREGGLASGVIFIFLFLHTPFIMLMTAGGLPRNFAFPLLFLWGAGAIVNNKTARFTAILVSSLMYPQATVILLAAEGLSTLWSCVRKKSEFSIFCFKHYALLVIGCIVIITFYIFVTKSDGNVYTLSKAEEAPVFSEKGKYSVIPRGIPLRGYVHRLTLPFLFSGQKILFGNDSTNEEKYHNQAYIIICFLLFLTLVGISPPPKQAFILLIAVIISYALARMFAFRLYLPGRYIQFGMPVVTILLTTNALGKILPRLNKTSRVTIRNFVSCSFVVFLCLFRGNGIVPNIGANIDQRTQAELYDFIRSLPKDVRFANHPADGIGIPFWTGRATMDNYETLLPWFENSWKRQVQRTQDTFRALYATDTHSFLSYCQNYRITHLFLSRTRYNSNFKETALLYYPSGKKRWKIFEPFKSYCVSFLEPIEREDLLLANPPEDAIIYSKGDLFILDVKCFYTILNTKK